MMPYDPLFSITNHIFKNDSGGKQVTSKPYNLMQTTIASPLLDSIRKSMSLYRTDLW